LTIGDFSAAKVAISGALPLEAHCTNSQRILPFTTIGKGFTLLGLQDPRKAVQVLKPYHPLLKDFFVSLERRKTIRPIGPSLPTPPS
jgi:hypothetical protein